MSRLEDNGGRLYAGYADAYVGYEPELLIAEGSFRALDEEKPPRIIAREAIETSIRTPTRRTQPVLAGLDLGLVSDVVEPLAQNIIPNILEGLDWWLPEEWLGFDITPGGEPGGGFLTGAPTTKQRRTVYSGVWIENGKVKVVRKGETRTLGYTPQFAKKKFRTKRRRKRLTKRDMYILEVLKQNPEAGALALML